MSQQVDKKLTKQVRIDSSMHYLLKVKAAKSGRTIRELVEEGLSEVLAIAPKHRRRNRNAFKE